MFLAYLRKETTDEPELCDLASAEVAADFMNQLGCKWERGCIEAGDDLVRVSEAMSVRAIGGEYLN